MKIRVAVGQFHELTEERLRFAASTTPCVGARRVRIVAPSLALGCNARQLNAHIVDAHAEFANERAKEELHGVPVGHVVC